MAVDKNELRNVYIALLEEDIIKELAVEGKTIIMISSDMTEVLSICQRIIVMHEGTITGVLTGDKRTEHEIMQRAVNIVQKEAV